jgi:hypothetical protein
MFSRLSRRFVVTLSVMDLFSKLLRNLLGPKVKGRHAFDGDSYHVDEAFVQTTVYVLEESTLHDMGFGELYLLFSEGVIDFDLDSGIPFSGSRGNVYRVVEQKGGRLVESLMRQMIEANQTFGPETITGL